MTQSSDKADGVNVYIAANFTIEPIEPVLSLWLKRIGMLGSIRFAPYNQVFQQLLEGGLLRSNRDGVNLVGLDLQAWFANESLQHLDRTINDFLGVIAAAGATGSAGAVLLFPLEAGAERLTERQERLVSQISGIAGWTPLDLSGTVPSFGIGEVRDTFAKGLGDIPFTEEMYAVAATVAARWIRRSRTKARKVVVLDCDNTLWQGVCGEGVVQVTPAHAKLQQFMLEQRDEGVLLAIASKNNESDVMEVLESEACLLKPEHFTSWQVNWQPKSEGLKAISEELGLALNSMIFVDDSPLECFEVRNGCPEVMTVQLPEEMEAIPSFLGHHWGFDRPPATKEDRERAGMYEAEKQRKELSRRALTREEFLASLNLQIAIAPAEDADFVRIAQLTQRTTQFNLSGVVYTSEQLRGLVTSSIVECWTVRVRDTFGDYGLVGVVTFAKGSNGLRVETFLLSCRALGRGVEDRMLDALRARARELGVPNITIPFIPTARNRPAFEFLARVCDLREEPGTAFDCVVSTDGDTAEWKITEGASHGHSNPVVQASITVSESDALAQIAHASQTADSILRALHDQKRERPGELSVYVAPATPTEEAVAVSWSDAVGVTPVGMTDNFQELGGSSLVAAMILARLHKTFGVELRLGQFFECPTVRQQASLVDKVLRTAHHGIITH